MSRKRNWIFTLNNYSEEDEQRLQSLSCRYIVYGRETAPSTGTPHLQGYICFTNGRTLNGVRRLLGECHLEVARGNHSQCREYCLKDGDAYERGDLPVDVGSSGDAERERWDHALQAAKERKVEEIPADIVLRYYTTIRRIGEDFADVPSQLSGTCGVWIYGSSGSGKTRSVFEQFPQCYLKGVNKWWDGYKGEDTVLLDDVDPSHSTWIGYFLKRWGDRYPFPAERKGGNRVIRPVRVIITSQYNIRGIFGDVETQEALIRRYKEIYKEEGIDIEI